MGLCSWLCSRKHWDSREKKSTSSLGTSCLVFIVAYRACTINSHWAAYLKFIERKNILKTPYFRSKNALLSRRNCLRDRRPKFHMVYVCDVTVFDEQTKMAESEGKREIIPAERVKNKRY